MKQKKPTNANGEKSVVFNAANSTATAYLEIAVKTARIAATVSDRNQARALADGVEMATAKARYADIRNTIGPALRFVELAAKYHCDAGTALAKRLGGIEQRIKAGFDEAGRIDGDLQRVRAYADALENVRADVLDLAADADAAIAEDTDPILRGVYVKGFVGDAEAIMFGLENRSITTENGVGFLVNYRMRKSKENKERGKTNQAKGNAEERARAAQDMETALNRVHDRMKHGAKNVIAECRTVCKEFKPLTTKKNALGKYEEYEPLTGAGGKPIKPETLATNHRKRFGTKKAKKAKAARTAKPKRRTK